jgi:hypothetical protein
LREAMRPFEIPIILALAAVVAWFMLSRIRTIRRIRAGQAQRRAETKSATDQSAESDN